MTSSVRDSTRPNSDSSGSKEEGLNCGAKHGYDQHSAGNQMLHGCFEYIVYVYGFENPVEMRGRKATPWVYIGSWSVTYHDLKPKL